MGWVIAGKIISESQIEWVFLIFLSSQTLKLFYSHGMAENRSSNEHDYNERRKEKDWDPCATLGIDRKEFYNLPQEEREKFAKAKFREKAKELHPDKHPEAEKDKYTKAFQEANQAYTFISDPLLCDAEQKYHSAQAEWQERKKESAAASEEKARQRTAGAPPSGESASQTSAGPETAGKTRRPTAQEKVREQYDRPQGEQKYTGTLYQEAEKMENDIFNTLKNAEYYSNFFKFYTQSREYRQAYPDQKAPTNNAEDVLRKQAKREELNGVKQRLRELTKELFTEHNMPAAMFNLYMDALSQLARSIADGGMPMRVEDLQQTLEYQIVDSYLRLARGTMTLNEVPKESLPEMFDKIRDPYGREVYQLKADLKDADWDKFDDALRKKIKAKVGG